MKKAACIITGIILPLAAAVTGLARDTYYPYQTYEEYYRAHSSEPAPSKPPASSQPQPAEQVKPPLEARQPIKVTEPPEFLFPRELGFGVAVGVPFDMFYVSDHYYLLQGDTWYRSSSYRGPWTLQGLSRVPPELRKHKLSKIRQIRNKEFEKYWNDKSRYQGRHFRAGEEVKQPAKSEGEKIKPH